MPLVSSEPDRNATEFPEVFAACVVTPAMKQAQLIETKFPETDDYSQQHDVTCADVPWSVCHSELVSDQRADVFS